MKAALPPQKPNTKHTRISAKLRNNILAGKYREQLPGQRVLAQEFGVNFLTIRKALATLVAEGLVHKQGGRGTFITRLKRTRTHNVAAILGGLSYGFGGQPTNLVQGIQQEAAKFGNDVIFRPHLGDPQIERQAIEDLISRKKCDGILLWPTRQDASDGIKVLQASGIPFVVVMRIDARDRQQLSYVVDDDFEGGYLAAKHLLDLGHLRIGFVGRGPKPGTADSFEEERWLGFVKALSDAGIPPGPRLSADWLNEARQRKPVPPKAFLHALERLSGIVCVNDRVALHLVGLSKLIRRQIPQDLSVVGYDDIEAAELFGLTTIHQPLAEIGAEAVRLLMHEIDGRERGPHQRKLVPHLVARDTTQAVPRGRGRSR